jgi:D-arginine dehydrogenase
MNRTQYDVVVVGAGIAGVSLAARIAGGRSVLLLDMEARPGFHSTGRSAAVFLSFYGNSVIRALTRLSRAFFDTPPAGFSEYALLRERAVLVVARQDQQQLLDAYVNETAAGTRYERLSAREAAAHCPVLDERKFAAAALTDGAADIDVDALQSGYLRLFRQRGGSLTMNSKVTHLQRRNDGWRIVAGDEEILAGTVVNAAGAWAGHIGALAGARDIGLQTLRRSAALIETPNGQSPALWPGVIDVAEQFYMKPEAGLLMISPADETPVQPGDVQPDDVDIATAVERIEAITCLEVKRVRHQWAGLRSFVADRSPVVGFDPQTPNFFWIAALGGYGIQTAPGLSQIAARMLEGSAPEELLDPLGIDALALSPVRPGIGPQLQ